MFPKEETPFDKFVSRGDLPEDFDIPGPHAEIDAVVEEALTDLYETRVSKIISVLGENGIGKSHLFWALRKKFYAQANFVYVPAPITKKGTLFHIYTRFMDDLGEDRVRELLAKIASNWGSRYKIYGVFRTTDVQSVIRRAIKLETTGKTVDRTLEDCIKAIIIFDLDPENRGLAERWIFGEPMDFAELQILGVERNMKEEDTVFAMMKLLMEAMEESLVLFLDELEKPFQTPGLSLEVEGIEKHPRNILEVIYKLINETSNMLAILSTNSNDWERVREHIPPQLMEKVGPNLTFRPFTLEEFKTLFTDILSKYWRDREIGIIQDPWYPLDERIIEEIFQKGKSNPRECLRILKKLFSAIAFEEWDEEQVIEKANEEI
ncbi:MAG: hypothetical protein RBG13Loki_3706 [Promethearchaeota archaeon CR_4]|nr:MAG: hypothetical protein RBG13Loki_3706 [Candidatus Lokiarchaeota archaeon CR_4]